MMNRYIQNFVPRGTKFCKVFGGVFTGRGAGDCVDEFRRPSGKTGTRCECPFAGRSRALTVVLQDALKFCDQVGIFVRDIVRFARINFEIVKFRWRIGF